MRGTLLFVGVIGFVSGILCRSLFVFPWHFVALAGLIALAALALFCIRRKMLFLFVAVACFGSVLGMGRVLLVPSALPEAFVPLLETEVVLEGTVAADPDIRETTQRVRLLVEKDGDRTKVLAVAPLYPEVRFGERVIVEGTLVLSEPFETEPGRTFRYDRFLAKDGVFALVEYSSLTSITPPKGIYAHAVGTLHAGKHAFQDALAAALPEPSASLASGLITGGKQGLGEELLDAFVIAGLVHIVVLSGYNVMIVAEGVMRSLAFLPKRFAALAAGLVIGAFVLAAGAGSASIRAGLMAGLALVARATGRTYAVVRVLLIVAVVMLLVNPLLLAYDPGFQLSFVATLGLILLAPVVEHWLRFLKSAFWRDLLAATIAAQLMVLPLLLYQTGLFSVVSLPANMLVLPLVPIAMLLSAIAGGVGLLAPVLAPLFGFPAHLLLSVMVSVAEHTARLPFASFSVPQFPFAFVVFAYAGLWWVIAKAPAKPKASQGLYV